MSRPLRLFTRPRPTTVEITQKTFQSRFLLRPGPKLNRRIIGALAKAKEKYPGRIHGFVFLSDHFHILATFDDVAQMASFMRVFTSILSREAGLENGWRGPIFVRRYHSIELSTEPEVELARLKYLFSNSCKENLVDSPLDWPGVSSAEVSITGEEAVGEWIHRTPLSLARSKGKPVSEQDFAHRLSFLLDPLPSLQHLTSDAYRQVIIDLVRQIEEETAERHALEGSRSLGADSVLCTHPHSQPMQVRESPQPKFHAATRRSRQTLVAALAWIVEAYRRAAERLRSGDRWVEFPPNTFPPHLPFVPGQVASEAPG